MALAWLSPPSFYELLCQSFTANSNFKWTKTELGVFALHGNDRVAVLPGVNKPNNWVIFASCEWITAVSLNDRIAYRTRALHQADLIPGQRGSEGRQVVFNTVLSKSWFCACRLCKHESRIDWGMRGGGLWCTSSKAVLLLPSLPFS